MKRLPPALVCLVIGFVCGWGTCYFVANRNIRKIQAAFPSSYQQLADELDKAFEGMTRAEIRDFIANIRSYKASSIREVEAFRLGQAMMAREIDVAAKTNGPDSIKTVSSKRLQDFLAEYDRGFYQSKEWQELAGSLAGKLRQ